jgi:H/ACA ribonucleoprotein complex subunit 4
MSRNNAPWEINRELIEKTKDKTNAEYGCDPKQRSVDNYIKYGVISLDKPAGPTSHEVAAWVKRIIKINRIGHGGTLETFLMLEKSQCDWRFTYNFR